MPLHSNQQHSNRCTFSSIFLLRIVSAVASSPLLNFLFLGWNCRQSLHSVEFDHSLGALVRWPADFRGKNHGEIPLV